MTNPTAGKIRMLDPIVASFTVEQTAAERLTTLDGKVVGLYCNMKLNAAKVLQTAAEIIQQRFTPARFVWVEGTIELGHDMRDEEHWREPVDVALVAIGD